MARSVLPIAAVAAIIFVLSGCSLFERPKRPQWRAQAENACFANKLVTLSAYIQPTREIDGPGICGLTRPLKVTAFEDGIVTLNNSASLGCPMTAAMDTWLAEVIQPAAIARFGERVVKINTMGTYVCRGMNNQAGARLSEHSFGNAVDIGGFVLVGGRSISVRQDWTGGDTQTKAFLREVNAGACAHFTTVLGPGSNAFHYDHVHVDLAWHGNDSHGPRRICKPQPVPNLLPAPTSPRDNLPDPPLLDEELEIARASNGNNSRSLAMQPTLDLATPAMPLATLPRTQKYNPQGLRPDAPIATGSVKNTPPPVRSYIKTPEQPAYMRNDGAFVPEGSPVDWDNISSIE